MQNTRTFTHPSVTKVADRLAQIRAMFAPNTFLILPQADDRRGETFGDDDMPIQSLPFELDAPDEIEPIETATTPAGIDYAESVSADTIAAAAGNAYFLTLNIEADRSERAELRTKIARCEAEQHDAYQCGLGGDWSAEIGTAANRILELDKRLEAADIATDVAAAPIEETAAQRYVREEAERRALPFWRYHAARKAEGEVTGTRFQRQTSCTESQVKFIRFLAGGDDAARKIAGCNLFSLRNAEASALIAWMKNGCPDA